MTIGWCFSTIIQDGQGWRCHTILFGIMFGFPLPSMHGARRACIANMTCLSAPRRTGKQYALKWNCSVSSAVSGQAYRGVGSGLKQVILGDEQLLLLPFYYTLFIQRGIDCGFGVPGYLPSMLDAKCFPNKGLVSTSALNPTAKCCRRRLCNLGRLLLLPHTTVSPPKAFSNCSPESRYGTCD